jgi:FMN phosphatase YigB (HAD superfamily)
VKREQDRMTPKAIVFDLGKVLVDFDYSIAARRIAARSKLPMDAVRFFLDHSPLLFRYEVGVMSTGQFFEAVRGQTGFAGTAEEFGNFFADIFTPIEPMVQLHAELRRKRLPLYIFSNTNDLAITHIRRNFPFFGEFDGYVLSYEHCAMKPDPRLYEVVERQVKRPAEEILYLDDRPENIAAGAARGWQTLLHESPKKTRAAVEQLGLLNHA